jgi:hypothetical protein
MPSVAQLGYWDKCNAAALLCDVPSVTVPTLKEGATMKKTIAIVGITLAALVGAAAPALAGPGCPDKPGACPPSDPFAGPAPDDTGDVTAW